MSSYENLPVILVVAKTKNYAWKLISDIVEVGDVGRDDKDYVWHIENKYYEADVIFHAVGDDNNVQVNESDIDALVIHLSDDEGVDEASKREARCRRGGVRLVAQNEVGSTLAQWAAERRIEAVALSEEPPDAGTARVRAALHAHVWRGLRMRTDAAPPLLLDYSDESSAGEEGADEDEEEAAVERAERFASVLASLPAAAHHAAALPAAERRRAAEVLVAAFARALGHPLD